MRMSQTTATTTEMNQLKEFLLDHPRLLGGLFTLLLLSQSWGAVAAGDVAATRGP